MNAWAYTAPKDEKAQNQSPDDNTADGADMIAAERYALMTWWQGAKYERGRSEAGPQHRPRSRPEAGPHRASAAPPEAVSIPMTVSIGIVLRITPVGTGPDTDQPAAYVERGRPSALQAGDTPSAGLGPSMAGGA